MPDVLNPQNQWETEFLVPLPGEPRNIGPLRLLFQRLLNRTERLKTRFAEILGVAWDATPPSTIAQLHTRVTSLENGQGGTTLNAHRTAAVLDHPDGSVTTPKIADGAVTTAKIANGAVTAVKLAPGALQGLSPYDIVLYWPSRIPGGQTLLRVVATRPLTIPTSGHHASAVSAPTGAWQAEIRRNGQAVGMVTFAAGSTSGAVSIPSAISLAPGDVLTLVAQAATDSGLLGVTVVLQGVA